MTINVFEDEMIDLAAYGPDDDDRPDDDYDMTPEEHDPAAERIDAHLDAVDATEDWTPEPTGDQFAPSFDEWNAIRGVLGQLPGTFTDYLADINDRDAPAGRNPIVAMLARKWASESKGRADWVEGDIPF